MRFFCSHLRVAVAALGHGQQTQLAERFDDHRVRVGAFQRLGGQGRHEILRRLPVGAGEDSGRFQLRRARLHGGAAALLEQYAAGGVENPRQLGRLGKPAG